MSPQGPLLRWQYDGKTINTIFGPNRGINVGLGQKKQVGPVLDWA